MIQYIRQIVPRLRFPDNGFISIGSEEYIGIDFDRSPIGFIYSAPSHIKWWDACVSVGATLSSPDGRPFDITESFYQTREVRGSARGPVVITRTWFRDKDMFHPINVRYTHRPPSIYAGDGYVTTSIACLPGIAHALGHSQGTHRDLRLRDPRAELLSMTLDASHAVVGSYVGYYDRLYEAVGILEKYHAGLKHFSRHSLGRDAPQQDMNNLVWDIYGSSRGDRRSRHPLAILQAHLLPVMPVTDPTLLRRPSEPLHKVDLQRQLDTTLRVWSSVQVPFPADSVEALFIVGDTKYRPALMDALNLIDQIPIDDWDAEYILLPGTGSVSQVSFVDYHTHEHLGTVASSIDPVEHENTLSTAIDSYIAGLFSIATTDGLSDLQDALGQADLSKPVGVLYVHRRNNGEVLIALKSSHDGKWLYAGHYFMPVLMLTNTGVSQSGKQASP